MSKVASTKSAPSVATKLVTKDIVIEAISTLNDRSGSSLSAIKKFIGGKYPFYDLSTHEQFIKKFIKKSLEDGLIKNSTGTGLGGKLT